MTKDEKPYTIDPDYTRWLFREQFSSPALKAILDSGSMRGLHEWARDALPVAQACEARAARAWVEVARANKIREANAEADSKLYDIELGEIFDRVHAA